VGSRTYQTQISQTSQSRRRRQRRFQEEAGEPEADAVRSAALENETASGNPLQQVALAGPAAANLRAGAVQRIQRAAGNQAVGHLLLQRQGGGQPTPAPATAKIIWQMPFDLGPASDRGTARAGLVVMADQLNSLRDFLSAEEVVQLKGALKGINDERVALAGNGPLTSADVTDLNIITVLVKASYNQKYESAKNRMKAALAQIFARDTSVEEEAAAEALHIAFIEGAGEDRIGALKETVSSLKAYSEKSKKVAEWAKKAASAIDAAKTVEAMEKVIKGAEGVGKAIGHIQNFLTVARSFATIAGFDNQKAGEMQNDINKFQATIDAIDVVMTFAKAVPLLGTLWSSYYKPLTDACIKGLAKIARLLDKPRRELALVEWMMDPRPAGQTPIIPKGLDRFFPGGQPILDFMYPLLNEGTPVVTSTVEQFFLSYLKQMNVGQPEGEKLEKESQSHWYNPFTWGTPAKAPNLMEWAEKNKDMVWAMLYGSLPHNLR